jgi:membrane-associated phospholipid phosphatase
LLAGPPAPAGPTFDPWIDGELTALSAGSAWALRLAAPTLIEPRCPCDRAEVSAVDRWMIGDGTSGDETAAHALAAVGLAAPLALAAALAPPEARLNDAALVLEAVAVTALATQLAQIAVGRPYPYLYGPPQWPEQLDDGVNYASFWSGHTALPMAAATSFAALLQRRHPKSGWRWLAWTLGPAVALGAGALQVRAQNHFPSDVLVGGLVGGVVGWGVVALHD